MWQAPSTCDSWTSQQQHQQQPPLSTALSVSSSSPCELTHETLEQYLLAQAQSGYGAKAAHVNCHIVTTIDGHPSSCAATAVVPIQGTDDGLVLLPRGFTVTDTHDVFETTSRNGRVFAVILFLTVVGVVMFGVTGVASTAPYVWIFPAVLTLFALHLMWKPMLAKVVFHKRQPGPQSPVTIIRRRLFGCETTELSTVAVFGQLSFMESAHTHGSTFFLEADSASGADACLYYSSNFVEAVAQYHAWRAYLAQYMVSPHPDPSPSGAVLAVPCPTQF